MKINQVGIQLYTLRDYMKTKDDIINSLKKVKQIGYQVVEVCGTGEFTQQEFSQILDDEGLICSSTHQGGKTILENTMEIVNTLNNLKCKYVVLPSPWGFCLDTLEDVKQFAKNINEAGKILHDNGKALLYHNHNIEFLKVGGKLIIDVLFDETDPKYLQGELDTYWVQSGGGNPTKWCEKLNNRLPILHIKDYMTIKEEKWCKPVFAEIGNGNLDFADIIAAAEKSGCGIFIVEQDGNFTDPFESIKMSFDYIKANLCK